MLSIHDTNSFLCFVTNIMFWVHKENLFCLTLVRFLISMLTSVLCHCQGHSCSRGFTSVLYSLTVLLGTHMVTQLQINVVSSIDNAFQLHFCKQHCAFYWSAFDWRHHVASVLEETAVSILRVEEWGGLVESVVTCKPCLHGVIMQKQDQHHCWTTLKILNHELCIMLR